jgi:16S rRNA (cytosine967-C5)-methyltransferase
VSVLRTRQIPADAQADAALSDLAGRADRVLVDAPCSGLGALRRNPDARWHLREEELPRFQALQSTLLARFARLARPGGLVIYATCSVLRLEDEEVVARFLERDQGFEPVPMAQLLAGRAGDLELGPHLRLWPHRHGTDGFFAAAFRRRG